MLWATQKVFSHQIFVVCFQNKRLIELDLLSHILKFELFIPNDMFASVVDNFGFYFLVVVDDLRKWILFAEGVTIFYKGGFLNFDLKSAIAI